MKKLILLVVLNCFLVCAKAQSASDSVRKYSEIRDYYLKYVLPIDSNGVYYNEKYQYWQAVQQQIEDSIRNAKYNRWVIKKRLRLAKKLDTKYNVNLKFKK